jgi:hypothetical protein
MTHRIWRCDAATHGVARVAARRACLPLRYLPGGGVRRNSGVSSIAGDMNDAWASWRIGGNRTSAGGLCGARNAFVCRADASMIGSNAAAAARSNGGIAAAVWRGSVRAASALASNSYAARQRRRR